MSLSYKFYKPDTDDIIHPVRGWNDLTDINQLDEIVAASYKVPAVIFKHSTNCVMSTTLLWKFEKKFDFEPGRLKPYFLDLIALRNISDEIAARFDIKHESPQIVVIKDGKVIDHASHEGIYHYDLKGKLK